MGPKRLLTVLLRWVLQWQFKVGSEGVSSAYKERDASSLPNDDPGMTNPTALAHGSKASEVSTDSKVDSFHAFEGRIIARLYFYNICLLHEVRESYALAPVPSP